MMTKRPTGWVGICRCGYALGAIDRERSQQGTINKVLSGWITNGLTVAPRFESSWSQPIGFCHCQDDETENLHVQVKEQP